MSDKIISEFCGEKILELDEDNKNQFEMLADFASRCESDGKPVLIFDKKNNIIKAGDYCGFLQLTDGTKIEILPNSIVNGRKALRYDSRKNLCRNIGGKFNISYSERFADSAQNFIEYFISIFVNESIKIMKSGLLSGYASVEENLTTVQGSIIFSENVRKNLGHSERLYVRHDVFTPDRAENRLIKAAAMLLMKLTVSPHNSHNLKMILSFLDEVKKTYNYENEFSKCINTRNTKKYSTVLNICRMLLANRENTSFSGQYVVFAIFFNSTPEK